MENQKQTILNILNKSGIMDADFCAYLPLLPYLLECAAKRRLPENAKTVICCVFPYKVKEEPPKNISRYAAVPDYHGVLSKRLSSACEELKRKFPDNRFEFFIDNSPIPEVMAACMSGLGVKGDNGLLITRKYGSYVFIGEIVTDLEVDCKNKYSECSHCGKCRAACPKGITGECLSAITQKKGQLSKTEIAAVKQNKTVWGCDICSDVCPLNKNARTTYIEEFVIGYKEKYLPGEDISGRAFEWRGEKVIKRNFNL